LGEAKDAPFDDWFEFDWFTVIEDSVKRKQLFIAGMTGCDCELHL
jgi:hypothetical protein